MKQMCFLFLITVAITSSPLFAADAITLEAAPPVVVKTTPVAGATAVDPGLTEIRVTFSKPMRNGSWSWSTWGEENFPETTGQPRYLDDERTCVLPVQLKPAKFYAIWLNSDKFKNFKDASHRPAVPYLLTFKTAGPDGADRVGNNGGREAAMVPSPLLDENQRAMLDWTDRQFRSFFDARIFDGWSENERQELETRSIDTLKGPQTREYYQAISTLAALGSQRGLESLRAIALDRREKDNRDRWMAVRALGIIGDKASVPEMIHLVYHGNVNTRWWAQISLVQLTAQNFGSDWKSWGKWWNEHGGQPPFRPEMVRWSRDPEWSEPEKLEKNLIKHDEKFLESVRSTRKTAN